MNKKQKLGSTTAKDGFKNEHFICSKFNNWKMDQDVQNWLTIMGYDYTKIKYLRAVQIPVRISKSKCLEEGIRESKLEETIKYKKSDLQIRINIVIDDIVYIENLSIKKANTDSGFNQIDKRPVSSYRTMWNFDVDIEKTLKLYTGEIKPIAKNIRDKRRMFFDEMNIKDVAKIVSFFSKNKTLVIMDILKGRGYFACDWILVTRLNRKNKTKDFVLKDINTACNFYAKGDICITKSGNMKIGHVNMQRKGGTPDPTSLQFKMNPLELFDLN
jgi:hypothetical protein